MNINEHIKLEKEEFVAKITLSKPPLNIFDSEDLIYLQEILKSLNNEENLKLIVIDSNQKVFSAGVNISDHSKDKILRMLGAFHEVFYTMLALSIPTMSLVKSGCFGGGSELALFCDLIIASENACFSHPEIKLGCYPPISLVKLPELVGDKKALELILTGNKVSAYDALDLGMVNYVFKDEEFNQKTQELINSIILNSSSVIKTTLKAYKGIHHSGLKEKLSISEKIYIEELMSLEDAEEGMKSFLEKRLPVWKNK
ncbi:MAG: hypothetical protein A2104_02510 [Candidatus Melainabacteria bacterium GWF2_32_7]|nr:MAG: hypothetical protein A2104_02510 [Candidatus Melainabacteria bacterium GWF2_32_7]